MCGIFGIVSRKVLSSERSTLKTLVRNAELQGRELSGFVLLNDERLHIFH